MAACHIPTEAFRWPRYGEERSIPDGGCVRAGTLAKEPSPLPAGRPETAKEKRASFM